MKLGDDSPFKQYVGNFPRNLSHYPVFYTDVERDYLKGSDHTIIKISKKKYDERHDYDVLCLAVPEVSN